MAPMYWLLIKFILIAEHKVPFRITCEITKGRETEN